jgi:hypothetical protein
LIAEGRKNLPRTGQRLPKSESICRGTLDGPQGTGLTGNLRFQAARVKGNSEHRTRVVAFNGSILKFSVFGKSDWQDFCL